MITNDDNSNTVYFIKSIGKDKSFTKEQLYTQNLSRNSLVWSKGMKSWKKLKDIPELSEVANSIPPEKQSFFNVKLIWAFLILGTLGSLGYWGYLNKDKFIKNEQKIVLKPIASDSLYNKYSNSIVLIKHSFLYKIKIGDNFYYFRSYDPITGKLNELKSEEELKDTPNVTWGTGFFIDKSGKILTCKHVLDVMPPIEDQNTILSYLKNETSQKLNEIENQLYGFINRKDELVYKVNTYSTYMSGYDIDNYMEDIRDLEYKIDVLSYQQQFYEAIRDEIHLPKNFVTKTSTQFGFFFNDSHSETLNDYIKSKSIKISDNSDLAIIEPKNIGEITNKKIVPIDLSRISKTDSCKVNINDEVRMIGYNHGISIANTSSGIKSQITQGAISQVPNNDRILYTIPALQGSSGSPIFDKYGRLVSVNFEGFLNTQSFNYGVPPKQIHDFLYNNPKVSK